MWRQRKSGKHEAGKSSPQCHRALWKLKLSLFHILRLSHKRCHFYAKRLKPCILLAGMVLLLSIAFICSTYFASSHLYQIPELHLAKKSVKICSESSVDPVSISIAAELQASEEIWARSVTQRETWVGGRNLSEIEPWDGENYVFFWNYFPPAFNCPHSVERIGFIGDGGKWMCGLELYENSEKPCILYSFGVANESSFEAEILRRTNCHVFAYDYSVKNIGAPVSPTEPRVNFKALGIGNKNLGKFRTLKHLMEQNGHTWIDILKMDIEGGEYSALDKVMEDFKELPFGQLLIEVHVDAEIFPGFYQWWTRLEKKGLRAFSSEVNHVACAISGEEPNYVEYSFLNIYGNHRLVT